MKTKLLLLSLALAAACPSMAQEKVYRLQSPGGDVSLAVNVGDDLSYGLLCKGDTLVRRCVIGMDVADVRMGHSPRVKKETRRSVERTVRPVVPLKFSAIADRYNSLLLSFQNYSVEFRAYDNGVAYRFATSLRDSVNVWGERMQLRFPEGYRLVLQQPGGYVTSCEEAYQSVEAARWPKDGRLALLPLLAEAPNGCKLLFSESDLRDYPGMFLRGEGANALAADFPRVPDVYGPNGDRSLKILSTQPYIARTTGNRTYPWRYVVVAQNDADLIENTLTCQLAGDNEVEDPSWIRPGLAAWEWWSGAIPYGPGVDFKAGCNLDTYKYYIDFASHYGIPYIVMDEGWAKSTLDPFTPNPDVDLHELVRYGREKNVGIVLWLTWLTVENHFDRLFPVMEKWGISGLKIDFMDRSDQWMVNYYERVARAAARHHLFVDFHGAFKPSGLEYRYPNVLSYEGVRGMEQMGGCRPENSVYLPFMRNAVGPMDYTPGAMLSMQPECYTSQRPNSASIGTRAYQLALFVLFESGLQMIGDNPTLYYQNDDCTRFIAQVPQTWDETRVLKAEVGQYALVAKRKGTKWYIGGMTNNTPREFTIRLDFLQGDRQYKMVSFSDGPNASRQAMDYRRTEQTVRQGESLSLRLSRNGGFAAVIE